MNDTQWVDDLLDACLAAEMTRRLALGEPPPDSDRFKNDTARRLMQQLLIESCETTAEVDELFARSGWFRDLT